MKNLLVMMGGGFYGIETHVGFLKALEQLHLVDQDNCVIRASSAGAIMAGMYMSGYGSKELESMIHTVNVSDWIKLNPLMAAATLFGASNHVYDNDGLREFLYKKIRGRAALRATVSMTRKRDFTPVMVPAVPDTILASAAIPLVFPPVKILDELYMDGGVLNNVPMPSIQEARNYDRIYVMLSPFTPDKTEYTVIEQLVNLLSHMMDREVHQIYETGWGKVNNIVILQPKPVASMNLLGWSKDFEMVEQAYQCATEVLV